MLSSVMLLIDSHVLHIGNLSSIGGRISERRGGNAKLGVFGVVDSVETLHKGHTVDEVEALTRGCSDVVDNQ